MDPQSFIEAIQANPGDEIPRLVYADWLDEQGDPRGELIRIQCEIARRPDNDLKRKQLEVGAEELLAEYGETWLEPLRELGAVGVSARCFHLGLVERLKISTEDFLSNVEALCQIEPALTMVQLTNIGPYIDEFAKEQIPPQITTLDLSGNKLTALHCQTLCGSTITDQLTTLDLKFNHLDNAALGDLCAVTWPKLQRLDLSRNRIGLDGASILASQSTLPELKVLQLGMNRIGDEGFSALLKSQSLGKLEELHLGSNGIGNASVSNLLDRVTRKSMMTLKDSTSTVELVKSELPPALKVLNLRYNRIGIEEQKRLKNSALMQYLDTLDLTGNVRESAY
ncbi:MAG: TIGR02996 domain-containing protein [Planctomycetaceae bacterium]|nr:TIGR02996 domain-containing protein [Planctomycetaceae bacterium]